MEAVLEVSAVAKPEVVAAKAEPEEAAKAEPAPTSVEIVEAAILAATETEKPVIEAVKPATEAAKPAPEAAKLASEVPTA